MAWEEADAGMLADLTLQTEKCAKSLHIIADELGAIRRVLVQEAVANEAERDMARRTGKALVLGRTTVGNPTGGQPS